MNLNFLNNYSGKLGAGDPYAASTQQYLNELTQIEQRLIEIPLQLQSPALEQSTRNDMLNEQVRLMARKSAIQQWLKLSREQKNKVNALNYVNGLTQKYLKPLNKIKNQIQGGDILDTVLNSQIAGVPLLLAVGVVGAGIYLITNMK